MIKNIFIPEQINGSYLFAQTIVGIEILDEVIHATKAKAQGKTVTILSNNSQPYSIPENSEPEERDKIISETIKTLLNKMGSYNKVRIAIPSSQVVFKEFTFEFDDPQKIAMILPFEIESLIPFPIDEAVIDFVVTQRDKKAKKSTALVSVTRRKLIEHYLRLLTEAGVEPSAAVVDMCALYSFVQAIPEYAELKGGVCLINFGTGVTEIGYTQDGMLRLVRTLNEGLLTHASSSDLDVMVKTGQTVSADSAETPKESSPEEPPAEGEADNGSTETSDATDDNEQEAPEVPPADQSENGESKGTTEEAEPSEQPTEEASHSTALVPVEENAEAPKAPESTPSSNEVEGEQETPTGGDTDSQDGEDQDAEKEEEEAPSIVHPTGSDHAPIDTYFNHIKFTLNAFQSQLKNSAEVSTILITGPGAQNPQLSKHLNDRLGIATKPVDIKQTNLGKTIRLGKDVRSIPPEQMMSTATASPTELVREFNFLNSFFGMVNRRLLFTQATVCFVLLGLFMCLTLGYFFFTARRLSNQLDRAQKEAMSVLRTTFDVSGKTLYMLKQDAEEKVAEEEQLWFAFSKQTRFSFLRYLESLGEAIDRQSIGLRLRRLDMTEDIITLQGDVKNLDAVDTLEEELNEYQTPQKVAMFSNFKLLPESLQTDEKTKRAKFVIEIPVVKGNNGGIS